LAGHSTPNLTARYSHRGLHDLAGAVEKFPNLLPQDDPGTEAIRATGTEGAAERNTYQDSIPYRARTSAADTRGERLRVLETATGGGAETAAGPNPLIVQGVEAGCDLLRLDESRAGDGT
jgi:hypothetical protein